MRVAIVHDWLYVIGGAERVLKEILRCFPDADVFALFDTLSAEDRAWLGFKQSRTSFLQRIPGIAGMHRNLLPLMPFAIEQFDLSAYDLIVSSSYAVAKGVITGPDQVHVAYIHSPMRYAWDLQHQYLRESSGAFGLKGALARMLLHPIRVWDTSSSLRPDVVVANSAYVARRIRKAFGRSAKVIHPPVDLALPASLPAKSEHFLTVGRLVGYKNTHAIVEAFNALPQFKLIVVGVGPEAEKLKKIAGPNVSFRGFAPEEELRRLMATARALIYAAEEDFGIVPVEAQAEGTPVIALGRGGARETVIASGPIRTGLFFEEASAAAIAAGVNAFVACEPSFSPEACRANALRFSADRFRRQFKSFVMSEYQRLTLEMQASQAPAAAAFQSAVAG
jgi:glycosyltransferase involved in cell wall biosynthesis